MSSVALSFTGMALAMAALSPALAHVGVLPPLTAFRMWVASVLPALVAIVLALLALLLKRGDTSMSLAALVLALIPVLILVSLVRSGSRVPRINDITTDLEDPPTFVHAQEIPANKGTSLDYPERFKARVRKGYADLAPAFRDGTKDDVFARAVAAAKDLGWEVTFTDAAAGRLEAVSKSSLWNFHDDVVIRLRDDGGKVRIDVRSRSRDGKGDFGANAARIRAFLAKI